MLLRRLQRHVRHVGLAVQSTRGRAKVVRAGPEPSGRYAMILIVTATDDLHAVAVAQRVRQLGYRDINIFECDRIAQRRSLSYRVDSSGKTDKLLTLEGNEISIADVNVIWLRRIRANQQLVVPVVEDAAGEIINNDCRGGFSGFLSTKFTGKWISDPESSIKASDKIYQLTVAEKNGFIIPKTLVTQSYEDLLDFFEECEQKIIVKTVVGVHEPFLQTIKIDDPSDYEADSYESSPAIYQELIDGTDHLRLLCFGNRSLCGRICTEEIDWRLNLQSKISSWEVPDHLHKMVRKTLDDLGLEMGVMDIKINSKGEYCWFEVNPQGQFIFLEPLTNINFIDEFSKYLISEANCNSRGAFPLLKN
jgi:hypothetical protein